MYANDSQPLPLPLNFSGIYMKIDKNTVIGFVLLAILFFAFFWYNSQQNQLILQEKKRVDDSLARVAAARAIVKDTVAARIDSLKSDSANKIATAGGFEAAAFGIETTTVIENELMRVTFTNKGGQVKQVELKKYKAYNGKPVVLGGNTTDGLGYTINTGSNKTAQTSELFFSAKPIVKNNDASQSITYTTQASDGKLINHVFTIPQKDYLISWAVQMTGAQQLLSNNQLNLHWNFITNKQQSDAKYEKEQSRICFVTDGNYDYEQTVQGQQKTFDKKLNWLTHKQQFFNATLIANNGFSGGNTNVTAQPDSSNFLLSSVSNLNTIIPAGNNATVDFKLYFGPNDYSILKQYDNQLYNIVDLGSGMFAFVKYINRWIIMPVFDFFASFVKNYGWVILLLTLFIRLVTSPLTYSSYLSGAKMKVLRPELDNIKKRLGDDQQAFAMEQMKLFREAGVNPLGGCIPALLQIPIFFALYSFFNSNIALRDQSFLWADDLSRYDVIATLPFSIPFGFGDHISLFTLTAVLTSFLISIYNMAMTPTQDNPMLKYMPYFFPFILLFVFNRLPSALTWYYTVSNLITLGLQFVIQNYIINHDKILEKIELKRKQPKQQSKWQEKYAAMMESQKKLQDMKSKTKK